MASAEQNARRRAQRKVARELREGTYKPGPAGKSYEQARKRQQKGKELTEQSRQFYTIWDACVWGEATLPPRTSCYLVVQGRLHVMSGDEDDMGKIVYRVVLQLMQARSLVRTGYDIAETEAMRLFSEIKRVILRWRAAQ
jgi:hypothetical protein